MLVGDRQNSNIILIEKNIFTYKITQGHVSSTSRCRFKYLQQFVDPDKNMVEDVFNIMKQDSSFNNVSIEVSAFFLFFILVLFFGWGTKSFTCSEFCVCTDHGCRNSPTPRTRPAPVYAVPLKTPSKGWDFKFLQQFVEQDKIVFQKIYTLLNKCNNGITGFHAKWIQTCLFNPTISHVKWSGNNFGNNLIGKYRLVHH